MRARHGNGETVEEPAISSNIAKGGRVDEDGADRTVQESVGEAGEKVEGKEERSG